MQDNSMTPLDTNKGEPMKTLPEILSECFWYTSNEKHLDQKTAQEAIAKELMGCLPEKQQTGGWNGKPGNNNLAWNSGHNQCLDEVRARLTAFIGHKEK